MEEKSEVIEAERVLALGWRPRLLVLGALLAGLGALVYPAVLRELALSVLNREGSSHGLFVPLVSGWFLWRERGRIRRAELGVSLLPGSLVIAAGFVLLFVSRRGTEIALPSISFLTVACGLVLLVLGSGVFRVVSFPLLFLAAMIPLPATVYDQVAEWVRAVNTGGSVCLTQALHVPIYRQGYTIQLPNGSLFVNTSCSGIRYLLSYLVFSLPYGYLFKRGLTARTLTVLAALPVSIVASVLRLSGIYLAVYFIGPVMARHRPHVLLSWFVFLGVLVLAISGDQYISRMWEKRQRA